MNFPITQINVTENVTLITLIDIPICENVLSKIFLALADKEVNLDMVSQSSPLKGVLNVSFTISDNDLFAAIQALKDFKTVVPTLRIEVNSNNTKISLYGEVMRTTPGIFAKTISMLQENKIDIIMITTSEVDISYLLYASDQHKATSILETLMHAKEQ